MSFTLPIGPKSEFSAPIFAERTHLSSGRKRKQDEEDRFIPSRSAMKKAMSQETYNCSHPETLYEKALISQLYPFYSEKTLLSRDPKPFSVTMPQMKRHWEFPKRESRVLDLPEHVNNFYFNNLDWGKKLVGVNLNRTCYAYSPDTKRTIECFTSDAPLSSIKWNPAGTHLASGNVASVLSIFDVERENKEHEFAHLTATKICSLDWRSPFEVTLGSDGCITHVDLRTRVIAWTTHTDPEMVCSLKWNGSMLATGNNSNDVRIFDIARIAEDSLFHYSHQSGVKALQWNPERPSLLMSGGGTSDQTLKLFDAVKGKQLFEQYVGSQICSMTWLDKNYFVLGLGYNVDGNNLQYWRYFHDSRKMEKRAQNASQEGRILNLAMDPTSSKFCTSSDRETLYFWEPTRGEKTKSKTTSIFDSQLIR